MRKNITTPWDEKTARQKAGSIGMLIGVFLACTILAYAAVNLFGSKKMSINNTKGHTFEMDLTGVNGGTEILPGTEQTLGMAVQNKSTTDSVYAFIEFDYDPSVYEITGVTGWEVVSDNPRSVVYSYSDGGEMNPVEMNNSAVFNGTLTCIADNQTFQELTDDDMIVDVTGYAISTSICEHGNTSDQVWADYQSNAGQ